MRGNFNRKPLWPRFWSKVDKNGPLIIETRCWNWTAAVWSDPKYGQFWYDGKMVSAHRFSLEMHKGKIPPGKITCHRCDNTLCVNPDHLYAGTSQDNSTDMISRDRSPGLLLNSQVRKVRERLADGTPPKILAKEFGVGISIIYCIKQGKTYKHV